MSMQDEPRNTDDRKGNGRGAVKMVGVALAAFAFTFSLVPMYRIAWRKGCGVGLGKSAVDGERAAALEGRKSDRLITVQFDGGVNSKLPRSFRPEQASMKVRPGQQYDTMFYARNDGKRTIVGNAVPSIAPARASRSEEHTYELQSLMRNSYAVFCLK